MVVEMQCERLRMLYRDCARPPPPPLQADRRQVSTGPVLSPLPWENPLLLPPLGEFFLKYLI